MEAKTWPSLALAPGGAAAGRALRARIAMARVHEQCELTVSVVGCGRMGCAIAGAPQLPSATLPVTR